MLGKSSWTDVTICNLSFVVSTPGAPAQAWHADGGHVDLQHHLPCHVLNVFLPLYDYSTSWDWGPTELRPGSHYYTRNLAPLMLAAKCRQTLRPTVAPLLAQGNALIFDYRTLHRGLANTRSSLWQSDNDKNNRVLLVLTVAQPWFRDVLNFPKRSLYNDNGPEPHKDKE